MPTSALYDWSGAKLEPAYAAHCAVTDAFKVKSGNYTKGTILGFVAATGAVGAYATGNSDGTETAAVIAEYDMYSDGTHVSITSAGALNAGETETTAPCYICGFFKCSELTGLDANGVTDMHARVIGANLVSGVLALM